MEQAGTRRKVLLLSSNHREISVLTEMLHDYSTVRHAGDVLEMMMLLSDTYFDVLLCDWTFNAGSWRDAVAALKGHNALLPTIVLSPAGGEYEWLEVLDSGAFDMLSAPWHRPALLGVLEHAFASRDARIRRRIPTQNNQETEDASQCVSN